MCLRMVLSRHVHVPLLGGRSSRSRTPDRLVDAYCFKAGAAKNQAILAMGAAKVGANPKFRLLCHFLSSFTVVARRPLPVSHKAKSSDTVRHHSKYGEQPYYELSLRSQTHISVTGSYTHGMGCTFHFMSGAFDRSPARRRPEGNLSPQGDAQMAR